LQPVMRIEAAAMMRMVRVFRSKFRRFDPPTLFDKSKSVDKDGAPSLLFGVGEFWGFVSPTHCVQELGTKYGAPSLVVAPTGLVLDFDITAALDLEVA
jgi:hypothetical protein